MYSFAHATMGHRLPTILGKAIDDVIRTLNEQSSEEEVVDLVECIERMEGLMTDLSGNANLRYIVDGQSRSTPSLSPLNSGFLLQMAKPTLPYGTRRLLSTSKVWACGN